MLNPEQQQCWQSILRTRWVKAALPGEQLYFGEVPDDVLGCHDEKFIHDILKDLETRGLIKQRQRTSLHSWGSIFLSLKDLQNLGFNVPEDRRSFQIRGNSAAVRPEAPSARIA